MKPFSKEFMLSNCGCYSQDKTINLFFSKNNTEITSNDILKSSIRLKDKFWFFCRKVFDREMNQNIAIEVAEIVLPIYEAKHANNTAPRKAIEAAKKFLNGEISLEELQQARRNAADAAYAAAYAAYAADAAYAAYDAAYAAYAAAYAAYAKKDYSKLLLETLERYVDCID